MLNICVEGWRNINHSFSLVNQRQLIELTKLPINLKHRDIIFSNNKWNRKDNSDGFNNKDRKIIDNIASAKENEPFDVIYRITFPFNFQKSISKKLFVFATSEQNIIGHYINGDPKDLANREYLKIIAPSNWSKDGLIFSGFDSDQIKIVPHGVDINTFKKIPKNETIELKKKLKINDNDFVISSVGAMTGNKGIHFLIVAYAILKKKFKNIKLILKDQSNLYNIKAQIYLDKINQTKYAKLISDDCIDDIIFISQNLDLITLNQLYNLSDCYVSPYKAEGFNLPPLEAAATGTPIIVTKGGSTDDYFNSKLGFQIDSKLIETNEKRILEPDLDSLIDCISKVIKKPENLDMSQGSDFIHKNYNWEKITRKLYNLFI
mgnify:CR=1 FL=1